MAIFKCKMCGGSLDFPEGSSVATCEYCGTKQTVPKSRDEVVSNLFNRANNLRLKCEFDKAEQVYEKILDIDNTDSEAHWGIVLCKYGIEYVEDPKTYSRIPTCHRTLYDAVLTDVNYLSAVQNADEQQKELYIAEAKAIDSLQKDILSIVSTEEPFDVFICYKETDEDGKRTVDSAIANDIYYQLTQEGFKVFYAPITLEDKLGHEYEPYIFAALSSAKVMLVVGTKPEYFDSVWVRNEWSRFLKLIKTDRSKLLIPCYRDMDAYELPNEFAHLQAQDMGKIGFINDVIRGLKKVFDRDEQPQKISKVKRAKRNKPQSKFSKFIEKRRAKRKENSKYCLAFPLSNFAKCFYIFTIIIGLYFSCRELFFHQSPGLLILLLANISVPFFVFSKILKSKFVSIIFQCPSIFFSGYAFVSSFTFDWVIIEDGLFFGYAILFLLNLIWFLLLCLVKKIEKASVEKKKVAIPAIVSAFISIVLVCVLQFGGLNFCDYGFAKTFYNLGAYKKAQAYFSALGDYKDSAEMVIKAKLSEIKNTNVLDEVCLDRNNYDRWYVIAKEDNRVLLLSCYTMECPGDIVGGWEKSSLRTFLNNEFYNATFLEYIKNNIVKTRLVNSSDSADTSEDKIFILSQEEVEKYLPSVDNRGSVYFNNVLLRNVEKGNIYCVIYDDTIENFKYENGAVKLLNISQKTEGIITYQNWEAFMIETEIFETNIFRPAMWIDVSGIE